MLKAEISTSKLVVVIVLFILCISHESNLFGQEKMNVVFKCLNGKDQAPLINTSLIIRGTATVDSIFTTNELGEINCFIYQESQTNLTFFLNGFKPNSFQIPINQTIEPIYKLQFEPISKQLDEIVVSSNKPVVSRKNGKTVFQVDQSVSASSGSVFDALKQTPTLQIDANDNIRLNGRPGIIIQIDGKNSIMGQEDLVNYLKGLSAQTIEKIEVNSSPSAAQDANGSGIINIVTKKEKKRGTNGTLQANYGQGVYPKTGVGLNVNHRNNKLFLFGSYNYSYRKAFNQLDLSRQFAQNGKNIGSYEQHNYLTFPIQNHSVRTGFDISLPKNQSLNLMLNGFTNKFDRTGFNHTNSLNDQNKRIAQFQTKSTSQENLLNGAISLNYKKKMDTTGTTYSVDLDYARYGKTTDQSILTRYYDDNFQPTFTPYQLVGDLTGGLSIHSLKSDFHYQKKENKWTDIGIKTSYVLADNNLKFNSIVGNQSVFDSTRSNHFTYKETIAAGYFIQHLEIGKYKIDAGLRFEATHINGYQHITQTGNKKSYIQLFPNITFIRPIDSLNELSLSLFRRIDRPRYDQLNPFKFYLDPSTYQVGNPYLNPQLTETAELTYATHKGWVFTTGYSRTNQAITEVLRPEDSISKVTVQTNVNLGKIESYYLNVSVPNKFVKRWTGTTNFSFYTALYSGTVARTALNQQGNFVYQASTNQQIQLGKQFNLELNGSYQSREIYAFDRIEPIATVSMGINYQLPKKAGNVKISFTDICYTNQVRAKVSFTDYNETFLVKRETRVLQLTYTYKLGKATVQGNRRRSSGADDLNNRVTPGVG